MNKIDMDLEGFAIKIQRWHDKNKRKFLWRERPSPYNVLLAEILLRQTGAWKVEEVFCEIKDRYPEIVALSNANIKWLQEKIEPLGLHRRAELLVNIAEKIIQDYQGKIPDDYDSLVDIKGIGKYTANSILCFSYGHDLPIVDGSVKRIFSRCLDYNSNKPAYADDDLWELADDLLPEEGYVSYNYGLLDLGAKICAPSNPLCDECPLLDVCLSPQVDG